MPQSNMFMYFYQILSLSLFSPPRTRYSAVVSTASRKQVDCSMVPSTRCESMYMEMRHSEHTK